MAKKKWTFLSNHGLIFAYLSEHPQATEQALAYNAGLSIRGVQVIVGNLEEEGYLTREKVGRKNRYTIHPELPMRHRLEHRHAVSRLLESLGFKIKEKAV
jgi:DNA-binding IclR family transcriptional regulator